MASSIGGRRGYPQGSRNAPMRKKGSASLSWKCAGDGCPAWGHQSKSKCARCGAPRPRGLGYNEQSYGSAASLAGNRAGNYVGADLVDQGPTIRECQKPDSDARIGMALPQTIAGVSVARAPLILPSPTSTAESTEEGSPTRNQRYERDAEAVRAAAAATGVAAAASACLAPTQTGIRTRRRNIEWPEASTETEEEADGDASDVSQPSVKSTTDSTRSIPFDKEGHPSGAATAAGPPDGPMSAGNDMNVADGDTEDQEEALPKHQGVISAVKSQSRGTGGRRAVANAEVVHVDGGTGGDERRAVKSGGNADRAAVGAQQEQQRPVRAGNEYEEVVHGAKTERPVIHRGQRWRTRIAGAVVVVALAVGGRVLSGEESSSMYRGNTLWQGDVVGVGQYLGSRGTFPWFGSVTVTEGGGIRVVRKIAGLFTYQEVSIVEDIPEEERATGFLCDAERFARRVTGQPDAEYGMSVINGQLVLGSGWLCREFSTPASGGVADHLGVGKRGGEIRHALGAFDYAGNFQVISSGGEVLWSSASSTGEGGGRGGGDGRWRFDAKGKSRAAEGPDETNRETDVADGDDGRASGGFWGEWRRNADPDG